MFDSSVYRNRRKALREKVSSGIIPIIHINSVKTVHFFISSAIRIRDLPACWT